MAGPGFFRVAMLLWALGAALASAPAQLPPRTEPKTEAQRTDEIDRLRAQLAQPGPDAAEQREIAIERLLSMADERAHAVLHERLAKQEDDDQVRIRVLQALARRLLNPADPVFGAREEGEPGLRLGRAYAGALTVFWQGAVDADGLLPPDPVREQARQCLVRLPVRGLQDALQRIAADRDATLERRGAALRAAGDSQHLHLGRLLAEFLGAPEPELRVEARRALRFLTFAEPFETRAEFEAWFERNGTRRYLDLAEEAARAAGRRLRLQREEIARLRRDAAAEYVRAVTERRNGIDWAAVQARTLGDDPAATAACLLELRRTTSTALTEDTSPARTAFARALLQGYRSANPADVALRSLFLEVAAYLCRPTEAELAAELSTELVLQLAAERSPQSLPMQLAALRGLRRFPSPEARKAVVALATWALEQGEAGDSLLGQALQTLGDRAEPPWRAPAENAPDKAEWLRLMREVCRLPVARERRREALAVMQLLDREGKRPPEVFDLLLEIVRDDDREPEFRLLALIQLQNWLDQEARADAWVRELTALLADAERDVRKYAAEALTRLPNASEERRKGWIRLLVAALRERIQVEKNAAVLRALTECLIACGRDPGSPEAVLGVLIQGLDKIGIPVPTEEQPRVDELLGALTTVAADPRAEDGQWVRACATLLRYERRRSTRHVLESHNAVLLGKEVRSADTTRAEIARRAMRSLLLAALLKPPQEAWASTPELRREAEDVIAAFAALAGLVPAEGMPEHLEAPRLRLLRLETLLAVGRTRDVLASAASWLAETEAKDVPLLDPVQRDAVRLFAADAALIEGRLDAAVASWEAIDPARRTDARAVEIADRIAQAFSGSDAGKAVVWLDRVVKATAEEAPAFRPRFLAWLQARLRASPADRARVVEDLERRWALFDAPDCPEDLKAAAVQLRSLRNGG